MQVARLEIMMGPQTSPAITDYNTGVRKIVAIILGDSIAKFTLGRVLRVKIMAYLCKQTWLNLSISDRKNLMKKKIKIFQLHCVSRAN